MKYLNRIAIAALLAGLFSLPAQAKLFVFACEPEWAALTKELAGEHAKVISATHPGQDPHYVQARPSLIAKLRKADLVVCTGAELEVGWMPMLQRRARNAKVLNGEPGFFEAATFVELLEIPDSLDRADGDVHGDGNPHVFLDPRRTLKVAQALSVRLQQIDPANQAIYQRKYDGFAKSWQSAIERWQAKAASIKGAKVIVHHKEWVYLLEWLGLERVGALEPKSGVPPTLAHLAKLKNLKAAVVIRSPLNEAKPSNWLFEQTGITPVELPNTLGAVENTESLTGFFDVIIDRLVDKVAKGV